MHRCQLIVQFPSCAAFNVIFSVMINEEEHVCYMKSVFLIKLGEKYEGKKQNKFFGDEEIVERYDI